MLNCAPAGARPPPPPRPLSAPSPPTPGPPPGSGPALARTAPSLQAHRPRDQGGGGAASGYITNNTDMDLFFLSAFVHDGRLILRGTIKS